ncbi:MAG: hypothetical protein HDS33_00455 [Bacteroides sp.]|nr:hypothetical protein [Bacteroides sp.]
MPQPIIEIILSELKVPFTPLKAWFIMSALRYHNHIWESLLLESPEIYPVKGEQATRNTLDQKRGPKASKINSIINH